MKTKYFKNQNDCYYISLSKKNHIIVDLYTFYTGISISNNIEYYMDSRNDMIECTKVEFDKAYHLALALISNKALNKK